MFVHLASVSVEKHLLLESPLLYACLNEHSFRREQFTSARDLSDLVNPRAGTVQTNLFRFSRLQRQLLTVQKTKQIKN